MYTVLLSGGSGKRLWPLSNALRSKQYIKLLQDAQTGKPCSMIQRVWGQLSIAGLSANGIICASRAQVEIIRNQLGNVGIAVESAHRDTFPAVALSCAYLKDKFGASDLDVVCIIPVDPFTDSNYFETLKRLPEVLHASNAEVALMGAKPTEPSSKYGYIVPAEDRVEYIQVGSFREKPDEATARQLISKGALWNCGVFCLRIGDILKRLQKYDAPSDYDSLYEQYELLPRISFDYEVLEKSHNLVAVGFEGLWKDLGTWNSLSEEMGQTSVGNCMVDASCQNTHVVNEMDIPVVTVGTQNLMIVASYDGILIADKEQTPRIKDLVDGLDRPPMYEERRWGTVKVLDICRMANGQFNVTRKLQIFEGQNLSYHYHEHRDEVWTILSGKAEFIIEGKRRDLRAGDSIRISHGMRHTVLAKTELIVLEVQVGEMMDEQDIYRIAFGWEEIQWAIDSDSK
jgi:mannose-1-phosphate guanylyltransferase